MKNPHPPKDLKLAKTLGHRPSAHIDRPAGRTRAARSMFALPRKMLPAGEVANIKASVKAMDEKKASSTEAARSASAEQADAAYVAAVAAMPGQIEEVKRRPVKDRFLLEALVFWAQPKDPDEPRTWVHVTIKSMPHKLMRDEAWKLFRKENPNKRDAKAENPYKPGIEYEPGGGHLKLLPC